MRTRSPRNQAANATVISGAGPLVAFYDAVSLKHLQTIRMPDDADQATASMRYFSH